MLLHVILYSLVHLTNNGISDRRLTRSKRYY